MDYLTILPDFLKDLRDEDIVALLTMGIDEKMKMLTKRRLMYDIDFKVLM